ncbi:MerR family transcriptional regulator [Diaphorobacter aerolatus]|uniref:MerR family transcriptional regulator n=1 Tax=Diaphorobacter aerolatus TaxID=1288495 RepID=A0A7H0GJK2_9BURK|nr:MerR family transcriptional regulator [Diaphorobacter aerolatus]QNP48468.1 MerR family transcriptional regulator [Diaphorobacter aerolatus]
MSLQSPQYRIGDAARLSGIPAASIRYYEKEGLLPEQARAGNQYRLYTDDEIHRLRFVRLCRAMDMSLGEVRTLLALDHRAAQGDAHAACVTLDEHLEHVRTRLAELQTLEQELLSLRGRCDGTGGHCHVIEALHERADAEPVPPRSPHTSAMSDVESRGCPAMIKA